MLKPISILAYLGMVGGLVALIATRNLLSPAPLVIIFQAAALALFLWARITFGRRSYHVAANPTEGGLVTTGPYRYIRHPIYAAMCLLTWGGAMAHWSWMAGACGGLVFGCAVVRIFSEEALVAARYPEYGQYAARTWRMIPFLF